MTDWRIPPPPDASQSSAPADISQKGSAETPSRGEGTDWASLAPFASPAGVETQPHPDGPPSFATCAVHPGTPATAVCFRCGSYVCGSCLMVGLDGKAYCDACFKKLVLSEPIPWERRAELGLWRAWWQTFRNSLKDPDHFFARVAHAQRPDPPILYASLSLFLGQSWVLIIYFILGLVLAATTDQVATGIGVAVGSVVGFSLIVPLSALLQIYVIGGITHLSARLFGGRGSFADSARGVGYALGMLAIGVVPYVGALAGSVLSIVLQVYAFKHAHGFSGGRAAAAVLVPIGVMTVLVLCGVLVFLLLSAGRPWA